MEMENGNLGKTARSTITGFQGTRLFWIGVGAIQDGDYLMDCGREQ